MSTKPTTVIPVGSDYAVHVGHGLLADVADLVPQHAQQVLVVHPPTLGHLADELAATITLKGYAAHLAPVPDAEAAKTSLVAAQLWGQLGEAGFTRTDVVVGLGGGTVTDLAGFVAATWLRGVPVIQVPTTVLGMVDAAVGGKTGINTAEGKNLVGAFHPPHVVVCDLDVLDTLPTADFIAGLAEIIKCGFIADATILELVEGNPRLRPGSDALRELIERAVQVKADVVAVDLKESGLREILNYGHTFGHAIEQVEQYRRRHGEAISIGMVFVAELARLSGALSGAEGDALVARHRSILESVGLPISYDPTVSGTGEDSTWQALLTAMGRDKKSRGSTLRFVVLRGVAEPDRLVGPANETLAAAYALITTPSAAPAA